MQVYQNSLAEKQNEGLETAPPSIGKRVMVTTANFRCLGYIDAEGTWRRSFSDTPLEDVLGWESTGAVGLNTKNQTPNTK